MYLLPLPQEFQYLSGQFKITKHTEICIESSVNGILLCAKLLEKEIFDRYSFHLTITTSKTPRTDAINLFIKPQVTPEQYTLEIASTGICIFGATLTGVRHGIQTLRQIIRQSSTTLDCINILDFPALPNRGFFHDVTRGQVPTLATMKQIADKMSEYKLNQLQLYIEHTFLLDGYSEIWRDDDPITAQEIVELDAYCHSLGIELVPSIACFGHLYKILSATSYRHLCELDEAQNKEFSFVDRMHHHTLDVSNPDAFALAQNLINQYIPLFSSKKFNIGADETFDLGKGKNKAAADEVGSARLYVDFLKKLIQVVKENGKEPMFWGDIVLKHPELLKEIPSDITCLNWAYRANVTSDGTRAISEHGIPQYLCSGINAWNHFIADNSTAYQNISKMSTFAVEYQTLGLLNTNWGDYGNINLLEGSIPGLIMGAAFSWNNNIPTMAEVNTMISAVEYCDNSRSIMDIISKIQSCEKFDWSQAVHFIEKDYCTIATIKERSQMYFNSMSVSDLLEANERLKLYINDLYEVLVNLEQSKRAKVSPYLLMAEGIELFNNIAACIISSQQGSVVNLPFSPHCVAEKLEKWILDYKAEWRITAKESEMHRIIHLLFCYADLLRTL